MFRFESPYYLYLLVCIPLAIVIYLYANYRRKKRILKFGDAELVDMLMPNYSSLRVRLKFILLLLSMLAIVFLLARPQFGSKSETVKRKGVEVVIALDISNSMLATDVTPNRLERAKRIVSRLVDQFESDKIGLLVFAGDAFTQLPITNDYISAKMFLDNISPALITRQGTNIAEAVNLASRSFTSQEGIGRAIILITDGENHEPGALEAVEAARENGIQVDVLGVGSTEGAPIPAGSGNNYFKDRSGNVVVTKLNEEMCQEFAKAGNGIYAHINNGNSAQKAINSQIDKLAEKDIESVVYTDYNEQFIPIAWIVLILLVAEALIMNKRNRRIKNFKLFS